MFRVRSKPVYLPMTGLSRNEAEETRAQAQRRKENRAKEDLAS